MFLEKMYLSNIGTWRTTARRALLSLRGIAGKTGLALAGDQGADQEHKRPYYGRAA
jgi:hypothetical protein